MQLEISGWLKLLAQDPGECRANPRRACGPTRPLSLECGACSHPSRTNRNRDLRVLAAQWSE
jgi:hypothetical protein